MPYTQAQQLAYIVLNQNEGLSSFEVDFGVEEMLGAMKQAFESCGCTVEDGNGSSLVIHRPAQAAKVLE